MTRDALRILALVSGALCAVGGAYLFLTDAPGNSASFLNAVVDGTGVFMVGVGVAVAALLWAQADRIPARESPPPSPARDERGGRDAPTSENG